MGAVASASTSNNASKKAAGAAGKASDATIAANERQAQQVRADTTDLRNTSSGALNTINQLYGRTYSKPLSYEEWAAQNPQVVNPPAAPKRKHGGLLGHLKNALDPTEAFKDTGLISRGNTAAATDPGRAGYQEYLNSFQPEVTQGTPDMSAFWASPDYQFTLGEGQKAIDRSLVARGRALSGSGVKEGERYASGLASREFGSYMDRLLQQAGLGSTGIGASAAAGANAVSNIGQAYQNAGAARGSAYMVGGQGMNNAIQGGVSNLLLMRYLQTPGAGGTGMQANNWTTGKPFGSYV